MNSNNIESQQDGLTYEQNAKIADIYQKMLLGDKSGLSNLQKIKTNIYPQKVHNKKNEQIIQVAKINEKSKTTRQDQLHYAFSQTKLQQQNAINKNKNNQQKYTLFKQTIFQKNNYNDNDKQRQKFRDYIKRKVNDLRLQKKIFNKQQDHTVQQKKQHIGKKLNSTNQSKSFDLVKYKNNIQSKSRNQGDRKDNHNAIQMKKVQSQVQNKILKKLPPIKARQKIPTQTSQSKFIQQNLIIQQSRQNLETPINLSHQNIRLQKPLQQNSRVSKQVLDNGASIQKTKKLSPKKTSLPQIKRLRLQFAKINEEEKIAQNDVVKYHQKTKAYLDQIKHKYQVDFRNQKLIKQFNKQKINTILDSTHEFTNKKKPFHLLQQKIDQSRDIIISIDQMICKKKQKLQNLQQKLNKNKLIKFWTLHDLHSSNFQLDSDQQSVQQQLISQSNQKLLDTYTTSMLESKNKNWRTSKMKKYDTNRTFQQYTKSRMNLKDSKIRQNLLNSIDQNEEIQQNNRVIVNSRLKKLLIN